MFLVMSHNLMSDANNNKYNEPVCEDTSLPSGSFYTEKALVIGLTGGIASGKTTVSKLFKDLGAEVISADDVVHRMMEPDGEVWKAIIKEFGEGILKPDGNIDRKKLGDTVFQNPGLRSRLEAITHPPVLKYLADKASEFRANCKGILILEIPLLIETSSISMVDKVIVVTAEQKTQVERLYNRYGISRDKALQRINAQLPMAVKIKHADWVVNNEGSLSSTKEEVYRIWCTLQKSLAQPK
ncbi:MAG: dephospho-CoA kinase [Armatimonadota bacterium]